MDSPYLRAAGLQQAPKSPSPGALPSPVPRSASRLSVGRPASPALSHRGSKTSLQGGENTPRKVSSSRRLSSNRNSSSPLHPPNSPLPPAVDEPPPLTAQKIAEDWFAKELEHHKHGQTTQTVVILHDACYGHRFSRPKTSKSHLSMIVERPERVLASVLGIATAYVRFGERHAGGPHAPHPKRDPVSDLPFTIKRSSRAQDITSPIVTNVHGTKWMKELHEMCSLAGEKLAQHVKEVARIEEADKPQKAELHSGDLYLSSESLNALQGALGGVCDGVDTVFTGPKGQPRNAFVCVRPPGHHCSSDWPSGFCWLNNVHVGIEYAAQTHGLTHAAIIDFDLHHGDGSQSITWERNEKVANMPAKQPKNTPPLKRTRIGYFSLHDVNSFPCEDGDYDKVSAASLCMENAHNQTIWNVHLQPWKTEEDFWKLYEKRYLVLLAKARTFLRTHTQRLRSSPGQPQPKAAIFISAGFDASEWEGAGMQRHKVNVPTEFYARFTRDIVKMSQEPELAAEGRVISVLEGGYSNRALTSGVLSHISGLCEDQGTSSNGPADPFAEDVSMSDTTMVETERKLRYNTEWWQEDSLYALETLVYPDPPPPPKKSQRSGARPNFATPTQSFTRKVVDPEKFIKNSSGEWVPVRENARPPTPPPPDVDWVTAAHELSKLLVPTDRQTLSCRPEELAEPRVKKEKVLPPEVPVNTGRQLRERKTKVSNYSEPPSDDESFHAKTTSRADSDRRKTTDGVCLNAGEEEAAGMAHQRRQSVASEATERPTSKGSAVAVRQPAAATAGNVQAKKTRTAPKKEAPAMKPPPRPIASRIGNHTEGKRSSSGASSTTNEAGPASSDLDQLTSGIKKITLKMPSREEHDARQKAAADEDKTKKKTVPPKAKSRVGAARREKTAAASSTAKKSASPTTGSSTETGPAAKLAAPPTMPARTQSENNTSNTTAEPKPMKLPEARPRSLSRQSIENMAEAIMNSLPPSLGSPSELSAESTTPNGILETATHVPAMQPRPDTPPPPPPMAMPDFIHYEPGTGAAQSTLAPPPLTHHPASAPAPATLTWLPPNTDVDATPTSGGTSSSAAVGSSDKPAAAPITRPPLPVFTASSHIPFGPAPGGGNGSAAAPPPPSLAGLTGQEPQSPAENEAGGGGDAFTAPSHAEPNASRDLQQ
ncbi:putative HOS3-like histone deacetylase-like protein [Phyllosticta capitalensis]